jgi:hypothetical protein
MKEVERIFWHVVRNSHSSSALEIEGCPARRKCHIAGVKLVFALRGKSRRKGI